MTTVYETSSYERSVRLQITVYNSVPTESASVKHAGRTMAWRRIAYSIHLRVAYMYAIYYYKASSVVAYKVGGAGNCNFFRNTGLAYAFSKLQFCLYCFFSKLEYLAPSFALVNEMFLKKISDKFSTKFRKSAIACLFSPEPATVTMSLNNIPHFIVVQLNYKNLKRKPS